jgi:ankyrin repeat protein
VAEKGHEVVVRLLLENKANADAKNNTGWAVPYKAARNSYEATVQLLLEHRADVNVRDNDGMDGVYIGRSLAETKRCAAAGAQVRRWQIISNSTA